MLNRVQQIKTGININVITHIKDLALEGKDARAAANIVGQYITIIICNAVKLLYNKQFSRDQNLLKKILY